MAEPATAPDTRHGLRRSNRRSSRRKSVLDLSLVTVEMKPAGFGLILDVSEGGLGVQVMNKIRPGTEVQISFDVPDTSLSVEAAGVVSWYDGEGRVGVRFQQFKDKNVDTLKRWIATLPEVTVQETQTPQPRQQTNEHPLLTEQVRAIQTQIAAAHLNVDLVLQFLVERVVELTHSTGGAIALGTLQEMICRASTGLAPDVGVKISHDSALTAECLRTKSTIRCDDTETDPRVDRDICRQLKLRSLLILPILFEGKMSGVLEVFGSVPNAFTEKHLAMLQQLAEFTAEIVYSTAADGQSSVTAATKTTSERSAVVPVEQRPTERKSIEQKKETLAPTIAASPVAAQPKAAVAPAVPLVSKSEIDEIALDTGAAFVSDRLSETVHFGAVETDSELKEEPSRRKLVIPLVILVVLLALAGWWFKTRTNQSMPQRVTATVGEHPTPAESGVVPAPASTAENTPAAEQEPIPKKPSTTSRASSHAAKKNPDDLVADSVGPAPMVVAPSTGPINAATKQEASVDAPSVTSSSEQISALNLPGVTRTPQLNRTNVVTGGKPIHMVKPLYPMSAREKHTEGDVVLAVNILKNGMVGNVRRVSGNPALVEAAKEAVRKWRYQPLEVNGEAEALETTVTIQFRLPNKR